MKKWLTFLFIVLIAMPACAAPAAQEKKVKEPIPMVRVGVIDMQKILRESKAALGAQAAFRNDLDAKRSVLVAKEKEIRVMEEGLKSADVKISEEARRQTTEKLSKEVRDLKRMSADMDEELKKKDVALTRNIVAEVMKIVNAYAKKENYTLILERSSIVAADDAADITPAIIKLFDAGK